MPRSASHEVIRLSPDQIFEMDPGIRFVALTTEFGQPIFSRMREGLQSISPEEADEAHLEMAPHLMTSIPQKMEPWYGRVRGVVIYHDRLIDLVMQLKDKFLVLAFEPHTSADTIRKCADEINSQWGE